LQKVCRETDDNFHGVLAVIVNGLDDSPFAVATIEMSPTFPLKCVPVLETVIWAPVEADSVTLESACVSAHDVDAPPVDVSVTDVGYADGAGFFPLNHHTVFGPDMLGIFSGCCGKRLSTNTPAMLQTICPSPLK
jgi:hypothetical protein